MADNTIGSLDGLLKDSYAKSDKVTKVRKPYKARFAKIKDIIKPKSLKIDSTI